MSELKPCQCGNEAKMISHIATSFVECLSCGIRTKTFAGINDGLSFSSDEAERLASESWNNRTQHDKLVEQNKMLREALTELVKYAKEVDNILSDELAESFDHGDEVIAAELALEKTKGEHHE